MDFDFNGDLHFENHRALLRPLREDDLEHLLPVAIEDDTLLQYSSIKVHTRELLEDYTSTSLDERRQQVRYPFVVFDKRENRYAGSTCFGNISNKDKRIEIGWTWYGRAFQKTGLNRSCKFLLMNYVFETLEFERLEFRTDERNEASRNAIQKIGGKYEGTLRSHTLLSDGFRRNTVYYGILRSEWPEIKAGFRL
jgi:N-acetyltransferase